MRQVEAATVAEKQLPRDTLAQLKLRKLTSQPPRAARVARIASKLARLVQSVERYELRALRRRANATKAFDEARSALRRRLIRRYEKEIGMRWNPFAPGQLEPIAKKRRGSRS